MSSFSFLPRKPLGESLISIMYSRKTNQRRSYSYNGTMAQCTRAQGRTKETRQAGTIQYKGWVRSSTRAGYNPVQGLGTIQYTDQNRNQEDIPFPEGQWMASTVKISSPPNSLPASTAHSLYYTRSQQREKGKGEGGGSRTRSGRKEAKGVGRTGPSEEGRRRVGEGEREKDKEKKEKEKGEGKEKEGRGGRPFSYLISYRDLLYDAAPHVALPIGVHPLVGPVVVSHLLDAEVVLSVLDVVLGCDVIVVEGKDTGGVRERRREERRKEEGGGRGGGGGRKFILW
jgi:hypothetical protein